jgi:hypothetical protein
MYPKVVEKGLFDDQKLLTNICRPEMTPTFGDGRRVTFSATWNSLQKLLPRPFRTTLVKLFLFLTPSNSGSRLADWCQLCTTATKIFVEGFHKRTTPESIYCFCPSEKSSKHKNRNWPPHPPHGHTDNSTLITYSICVESCKDSTIKTTPPIQQETDNNKKPGTLF